MTITITAIEGSPDGGKGLARDTRRSRGVVLACTVQFELREP